MAFSTNMVSSFFEGLGDIFFYNLNSRSVHPIVEGEYLVFHRHEYGAPSADEPCEHLSDGCSECSPEKLGHFSGITSRRTFDLANRRDPRNESKTGVTGMDVLTFLDIASRNPHRVAQRVVLPLHEPGTQLSKPSTQASILFGRKPVTKAEIRRELHFSETGDNMHFLVEAPDVLRESGSSMAFGFFVDHEYTREMEGFQDRPKENWGFQFVQIEVSIQRPDLNSNQKPTSTMSYRREVVIAIKIADQRNIAQSPDLNILHQKFLGFGAILAMQLDVGVDYGWFVRSRYEIYRKQATGCFPQLVPSALQFNTGSALGIEHHRYQWDFEIYMDNTQTRPGAERHHPNVYGKEFPARMQRLKDADNGKPIRIQDWVAPQHRDIGIKVRTQSFDAQQFETWLYGKKYQNLTIELTLLLKWLQFDIDNIQIRIIHEEEVRKAEHAAHANDDDGEWEDLDIVEDMISQAEERTAQEGSFANFMPFLADAAAYISNRLEGIRYEKFSRERAGFLSDAAARPPRQLQPISDHYEGLNDIPSSKYPELILPYDTCPKLTPEEREASLRPLEDLDESVTSDGAGGDHVEGYERDYEDEEIWFASSEYEGESWEDGYRHNGLEMEDGGDENDEDYVRDGVEEMGDTDDEGDVAIDTFDEEMTSGDDEVLEPENKPETGLEDEAPESREEGNENEFNEDAEINATYETEDEEPELLVVEAAESDSEDAEEESGHESAGETWDEYGLSDDYGLSTEELERIDNGEAELYEDEEGRVIYSEFGRESDGSEGGAEDCESGADSSSVEDEEIDENDESFQDEQEVV